MKSLDYIDVRNPWCRTLKYNRVVRFLQSRIPVANGCATGTAGGMIFQGTCFLGGDEMPTVFNECVGSSFFFDKVCRSHCPSSHNGPFCMDDGVIHIYSNVFRIYHDDVGVNNARYFHCLLLNSMVPWPYIFNWVDFIVSLTAARVDGWPLPPQNKPETGLCMTKRAGRCTTYIVYNPPCLTTEPLFGRGMTSTTSSKRTAMLCSRMVTWKKDKIGFSWDHEKPGERKLGEFLRIF